MIVYYKSHSGYVRSNNEDYYIVYSSNNSGVFIIADGMGGHVSGEVASYLASTCLFNYLITKLELNKNIEDILYSSFNWTNDFINNFIEKNIEFSSMGTTLLCAVIINDDIYIANVGDSRAYFYDGNQLHQVTEDHSLVYQMYKNGDISKEQINLHPQKNIITQAIGLTKNLKVDIYKLSFLSDDNLLLLCTDGLTNMLNDEYIEKIISNSKIENITDDLIEEALRKGGKDNISVILVKK